MKHIVLALALSITVSGFAQESKKSPDPCDTTTITCTPIPYTTIQPNDPTYIGVIHHSHKLRNALIVTGVIAGTAAIVILTHSGQAASHGSSGQYPSVPFTPSPAVQK